MGLDISAFANIELLEILPDYETYKQKYQNRANWDYTLHYIPSNSKGWDFSERIGSIEPGGVYKVQADRFDFRAGSYSWYNWWRNQLCLLAIGVSQHDVADAPEKYEEAPFFPLIWFSDCEGILGPEVCMVLAADFEKFQEKADQHPGEGFREAYTDWRKACQLAAKNGYIRFH